MRHRASLASLVAVAALAVTLVAPIPAEATLTLLRPDPLVSGTFYGHGGLSTDGWGGSTGAGSLQADVPIGSSIYRAWLYAAGTPFDALASNVTFAGQSVAMTTINDDAGGRVSRGEVTSIVSDALTSEGGPYSFAIIKPPSNGGVALAVIYGNPSEPNRTIALLDGGALPTGDSATFSFAGPLDPTTVGFDATLALGITFSYQGSVGAHNCGTGQVSNVDINGARLTSCAGSADDSVNTSGLITVGGVGDSTDNPPNPLAPGGNDDELYNLVPSLEVGDTALTVTTANPSNNDYIFLAAIAITARASVSSTGSPTISTIADQAIDSDTSTAGLPFTVGDAETAPAALVVTATASNLTLVPNANIVLGGSGAERTATVTPAAGQTGTATIYLTVTDGDENSSVSSFELTVSVPPPPAGPTAVADTASTDEDTLLDGSSVLTNDSDPVGDGLTAVLVDGPTHGDVVLAADGTFEYTPDAEYNGTDTFTYKASDGTNVSSPATVTITIDPIADQPVCTGGTLDVNEDDSGEELVVCTQVDDVALSIGVANPVAQHGTVGPIDASSGAFTYTPDPDYTGADIAWFKASGDGIPDSAKVAFAITVHAINDAPVAVADVADAAQSDDPIAVSIDVLANDSDVDGDDLTITDVSETDHGSATIAGDHIDYTPDAGYGGEDSFTYTVSDGSEEADATVTVTVAPDVDAPSLLAPTHAFVVPSTSTRTATKVRFSWPRATDTSGIVSYEAQLSTDDSAFVEVGGPSLVRTVDAMLEVGHTYQLKVRATDGVGNVTDWKSGLRFGVSSRQTPAFTYTKHWTIIEGGTSAGTGFRYSTARGASASITAVGRSFAWIAPKNRRSGKAAVYVDGRYVATVNLYASTSTSRRTVFAIAFSGRGTHTFSIRNLGTLGHSRVSLDALVILR